MTRTREIETCECRDRGCPEHLNNSECNANAEVVLHRIDMEDQEGAAFCPECAEDAMKSGVFA